MKGLNLSGWSKISEDKNSTTLMHEKQGHKMIIAHDKLPRIQKEALKRLKLADGTPDGTVGDKADEKPQAPVVVNVGAQPAISQPVQSAKPVPVAVPQIPQTPNVLLPNGSMNAPASAQTAQEGAKLGAQVQAAKSAAAVPQEQQYLDQTAKYNQDFANNLNNVKQKADDFAGYVRQNPLRENAYLEDGGAGRKMKTALGLLFSGAGSGVTGQPNMAYDFLNKQIDRNIQAQKDRFGQQNTVWGAYKDLYQNEVVANNMARVHALDMLEHQGRLTAAQLGTPSAAAGLMDLQSKIAPERNRLIMESAGNLSDIPNNPSRGGKSQPNNQQGPNITNGPMAPEEVTKLKNSLVGPPTANASIPEKEEDYHILNPTANDTLHSKIQYGSPKAREDYPAAREQLKNAQIADASMEKITNLFPKIKSKTNVMGSIGSSVNPHALGAIGAGAGAVAGLMGTGGLGIPVLSGLGLAAGEGTGHLIAGAGRLSGNKEAQFQALKGELKKLIISALPNASAGEIDDIVERQVPGLIDDDETMKTKLNAIREFIKTKTPHDLIDNYNLGNKK